jgi:SAM-dependent methyltransferase
LGRERDKAHRKWYRTIAEHYDALYDPHRASRAYPFLQDVLRRHDPVKDILDPACETFALEVPLVRRGYDVVGRDLSPDMLRVARRNALTAGLAPDLGTADMQTLRHGRTFDAVLCLGTAFNYLRSAGDARKALRTLRAHLRPGGRLVLDLTNFDAWMRKPNNVRAETDYRAEDGTRIAIYALNEQDRKTGIHLARMITVVQKRERLYLAVDEAPMKIWTKDSLAMTPRNAGFRPVEWWGDLRLGSRYERHRSPRLVAVGVRE